jgi:hypothetical protein
VKAIESKYVLPGFASARSAAAVSWHAPGITAHDEKVTYLRGYHHQRGRTVCVNGLEAPMESTDHAVLTSIEHDLLRSEVLEHAIEFAIDELRGSTAVEQRREEILAEIRRLDAELTRRTTAIASGGDLPALLAALKERQVERERCERPLLAWSWRSGSSGPTRRRPSGHLERARP